MRNALAGGTLWALCALLLCAPPLQARGLPQAPPALLENGAYGGELITRIRESKRRIVCAFYLFKVGEKRGNRPAAVAAELVKARRRGVDVTVILDGGKQVGPENRAAAGILSQGGVKVLLTGGRRVTHVKAVVVDDRYVLIGSHNLTHSALTRNDELSVLLDSPELAARTTRYLEKIR